MLSLPRATSYFTQPESNPLDLSQTMKEDEALDLSTKQYRSSSDMDSPINLAVLKVQRQGVEVSGDRPLNLITASNIATSSSHCKRFSKELVVPSTLKVIENTTAKPNSINSSASCQNLALNTSKFAISVLPDTQFLDTSLKNKTDSERNDETDDDDSVDMPLGDASLLNDLSIFEYFEPYQHISILEEEIVHVANETEIEKEKRMLRKRPYTTTRLPRSPLLENGYRVI
ncbi:uncharacterized protein LOC129731371 [Wyeomyia smithii]|uniref:uncharacterized protein LOC129731371 n=1 Tax=Wyeomyia smithii TaxID=174621 RepID=UPI002467CAE3|nr:uncharacterized protein LOC129731371 [Wyeomyia smithii]